MYLNQEIPLTFFIFHTISLQTVPSISTPVSTLCYVQITQILQGDLEIRAKYISGYDRWSYNRKPDQVKTEKRTLKHRWLCKRLTAILTLPPRAVQQHNHCAEARCQAAQGSAPVTTGTSHPAEIRTLRHRCRHQCPVPATARPASFSVCPTESNYTQSATWRAEISEVSSEHLLFTR